MDALLFPRKEVRYVAAMAASRLKPGAGASVGPLKLTQLDPPDLPGVGWEHVTTRLAGICGSDLATIDGQASRYFESLASFPFIPGHEVVGERADGSRVVLEPVLGPETRGEVPAWPGAAQADGNDYGHLVSCNWLLCAAKTSDQPPPVLAQEPVCKPGSRSPDTRCP